MVMCSSKKKPLTLQHTQSNEMAWGLQKYVLMWIQANAVQFMPIEPVIFSFHKWLRMDPDMYTEKGDLRNRMKFAQVLKI